MTPDQKINRRGVSLAELLLVMSSFTVILATSGVLLHRVMRIDTQSRAFADAERACTRLSHQFRQDVHEATAAELSASRLTKGLFLRLLLPNNRTIEYGREQDRILRTVRTAEKIVARDEFAFESTAVLTIDQSQSPNRIVLSIATPTLDLADHSNQQLQNYRAEPVGLHL